MTGYLYDPFSATPGFDLEARIRSRAASCGVEPSDAVVAQLAYHARAVLRESERLHLTSITEPEEFLERHLGESFEGAAMLAPDVAGVFLDIGSGNGYPGIALAAMRPGLELVLVEASVRKAEFLRAVIRDGPVSRATVLERQVQRPADLEDVPPARLITSRAMGGWPKVLPRLHGRLAPNGEILVWAGDEVRAIARRTVWKRFHLEEERKLPAREHSSIWRFRHAPPE